MGNILLLQILSKTCHCVNALLRHFLDLKMTAKHRVVSVTLVSDIMVIYFSSHVTVPFPVTAPTTGTDFTTSGVASTLNSVRNVLITT